VNLQGDFTIAAAAFAACAINAGAGGGSFISFPAALGAGLPPIPANATNNAAMWLGAFASTGELRSDLSVSRATLVRMLAISTTGSVLGAILLLRISNAQFDALIPWLLLLATSVYIAGPAITAATRGSRFAFTIDAPIGWIGQFVIAVYGGFFGAAIGILTLALLGILGLSDARKANALKVLLATVINGVAVVPFLIARVIWLEPAAAMSAGALLGGFVGARLVKTLPSLYVRRFVIVVAVSMTVYFFVKTYRT
jgi:uncharacterized membrane protein YfcA